MAVITFFAGSYCRAEAVLEDVARQLGYEDVTARVLEQTSRRFDVEPEKLTRSLYGPEPFLNKITHERRKAQAYLKVALAEMIQSDNCLITGCVGHLLPRTIAHVLRICLIANHEYRVAQAVRETGKSEGDVAKMIHADDKQNFYCTTNLLDKTAYDESLYDVVIPMHEVSPEEAARQICEYAQRDAVKTTERSRNAARDFVLSAQVNLAMVKEGHKVDVHSEGGNVVLLINEYVVRQQHHEEKLTQLASTIPGVTSVTTRLGPKFRAPSINPWSEIEGPPKILLVDDEKEFIHTLSERLRTRNLESAIAYDGEQALDMLQEDVPDVMVLDLMMPGIDGIEVLRRIKRTYPKVEVIILTGHGSDREQALADELGAFAYLNKPIDIDHLTRVMKAAYRKTSRSISEKQNDSGTSES